MYLLMHQERESVGAVPARLLISRQRNGTSHRWNDKRNPSKHKGAIGSHTDRPFVLSSGGRCILQGASEVNSRMSRGAPHRLFTLVIRWGYPFRSAHA